MKGIKIYLVIVSALLFIALGFGVYIWFTIQSLSNSQGARIGVPHQNEKLNETPSTLQKKTITIKKDSLSETQQKTLETLGYTQESFTITPSMILCAEEAVGKTRLTEIISGVAPSSLESMKLLPCLKK